MQENVFVIKCKTNLKQKKDITFHDVLFLVSFLTNS